MASKYRKLFKVPPDFENILNDFAKEILRNQPRDILDFGIKYFGAIEDNIELDYPDKGDNLPCSYKRPTKKREIIRAINKMEMSIEDQGRFHRSMDKIERMHQYDLPKRDPDPNIEIEDNNDVRIVKVPDKIPTDQEININNFKKNEDGIYEEDESMDNGGEGASREIKPHGGTASRPESNKDVNEEVVQTRTVVNEVIVNGEVVKREEKTEVIDGQNDDSKGNLNDDLNNLDDNNNDGNVDVQQPNVTDVNVNIEAVNKNSGNGSNMEEPVKQKEDEEEEKEEPNKEKEDGSKGGHSTPKDEEGSPEEEEPKQDEDHYDDNFGKDDEDAAHHQDDENEVSYNKSKEVEGNHEDEYEEPKEGEEEAPNGSVTEEELKKQNKILEESKKNEDDNASKKESNEEIKEKEEDAKYEEPSEDSFNKELTESQKNYAKKDKSEGGEKSEGGDKNEEGDKVDGEDKNKDDEEDKSEEGDKFGEEDIDKDKKDSNEDIVHQEEGKIKRRPSLMKQLRSKDQIEFEDKKSNLAEIIKVTGTKTKDSRGNDALEVEVSLSGGIKEKVILPSKLSKDEEEEDNENERKAKEKGIDEAVSNVNDIIAPVIQGMGALNQIDIDKKLIELDGTKNKSKLGSNSTLAVSLAVAKTASVFLRIPLYRYIGGISAKILPVPCMNIINTNTGESTIDFKEYFIIPAGFKTYKEAHQAGQDIYNELKNVMKNHNYDNDDDDGFKPLFKEGNKEVFKLITEAVNNTQYKLGENIFLGLNIAASQLYDGNSYNLKYSGEGEKSTDEMIDYIEELVNEYPSIITIEDGLARNDWEGWQKLTERLGNKIQLVGYDLFVTNIEIIEKGIKEKVGNCVLINPNQVGTLSETLDAVRTAQTNNYTCMITHVEGEIEDGTIADLAVGTNSGLIRSGSVIRNDSMEAYKRLMKIEEELKKDALFLGIKSFQNYKI